LRELLPLSAAATPELATVIRQQSPRIDLPREFRITRVDYAGDEGGIMCRLVFDDDPDGQAFFVSMTHLRFARSAPFSREIASYQKHRLKRIRRQIT
jgi:hypothetical protein